MCRHPTTFSLDKEQLHQQKEFSFGTTKYEWYARIKSEPAVTIRVGNLVIRNFFTQVCKKPHPIHKSVNYIFPKKTRLFFKSNEAEIMCLHIVVPNMNHKL